jgi:hypothetical protein
MRIQSKRGRESLAAFMAAGICLLCAGPAEAGPDRHGHTRSMNAAQIANAETTLGVEEGRETWRGTTLAVLSTEWWRWLFSIPLGPDPNTDTSGANCGVNQHGDVWFLAGPGGRPGGNTWTQNCTIPFGKAIFSGLYSFYDDYPCPDPEFKPVPGQSVEDFLFADLASFMGTATLADVTLDGRAVPVRHIKSHVFPFTAAISLQVRDPCFTGSPQLGVSDGLFFVLAPLPRGLHVIQIRTADADSSLLATVNLTVR